MPDNDGTYTHDNVSAVAVRAEINLFNFIFSSLLYIIINVWKHYKMLCIIIVSCTIINFHTFIADFLAIIAVLTRDTDDKSKIS